MKVTKFQPQGFDAVLRGLLSNDTTAVSSNTYAINGITVEGAAGSNYHIVAYSSNYARWIPHDASGGGSVSYGSNAMAVNDVNAGGSSTDVSRMDHRHQGIATITASSSNTMQRPIVNLRPGTGVSFGLTSTDGDAALDTITINSTASGGGSLTVADEGTPLSTAATTLDFVGAGVTASGTGATKTITIAGGGASGPPLDGYSIDGTYGDHFTASSLSGSWTRRNYASGDETYQVGYNQTYLRIAKTGQSAGDGYLRTAPSGDWTFAMKYILRFFPGVDLYAWGLCCIDSSGTGVATVIYNNPNGPLLISLTTYSTYGGSFVIPPSGASDVWTDAALGGIPEKPVWMYLRKSGTNYYMAYSLDGEVWSPETPALSAGFTVDRIGMLDGPLGVVTTGPGSYVDVDWFNKIA